MITRRGLIVASTALVAGCDRLSDSPRFRALLASAEGGNEALHRVLVGRMGLAHEYRLDQRSPVFRSNGTAMPAGDDYARHVASGFADWRVVVDGLVARPYALSVGELRALPTRSQVTRHDCVEGWSAIAQWTGTPLSVVLDRVGLLPSARYLVFHCADAMADGSHYYESIDLIDACHPQTILAWALNGEVLPVANGAPLRLRVERQLGYKHAKYVQRIEAVAALAGSGGGKGGYWEDTGDYEWYAGA